MVYAQRRDLQFFRYTVVNGLSHPTINCFLQDKKGFIWIGTENGLNRFDGYDFKIFKNIQGDSLSLSNNYIHSLGEDKEGNIWVGTDEGLNKLDPETGIFNRYFRSETDSFSISQNMIRSMFTDKDYNLWFETYGQGICKYDEKNKRFIRYPHKLENDEKNYNNYIFAIDQDSKGNLWIATYKGLNYFNTKTNQYTTFLNNPKDSNSIASNVVTALEIDSRDRVWLGYLGADFDCYDINTGKFQHFHQFEKPTTIKSIMEDDQNNIWIGSIIGLIKYSEGSFQRFFRSDANNYSISNSYIKALFQDDSKTIWIGTQNGISKLSASGNKFNRISKDDFRSNTLSNNNIQAVYQDNQGFFWFGTYLGGLNKYDPLTDKYKVYKNEVKNTNSLSDNDIRCILEIAPNDFLIGTFNNLSRLNSITGKIKRYEVVGGFNKLVNRRVVSFYKDSKNRIWLGTFGGGVDIFDPATEKFYHHRNDPKDPNSLSENSVFAIHEDKKGKLWFGTYKGLNSYDAERDKYTRYLNNPKDINSLSHNKIYCLTGDSNDNVWIGTLGGGLSRLNTMTGKFKTWTEKDGLPSDNVCALIFDKKGRLWISTSNGVARFDTASGVFRNYNTYDGLLGNEFFAGAFFFSEKVKSIYFGGPYGINFFNPDSVIDNTIVPKIVFTGLKIFNQSVQPLPDSLRDENEGIRKGKLIAVNNNYYLFNDISYTNEIILDYTQNIITIEFAALHYAISEKNKYSYILENFEKKWNNVNEIHSATYTNLDPGEYIFRVKASNGDGYWNNQGIFLKIKITPPFWHTGWFISICVFGFILFLFLLVMGRERNLKSQRDNLEVKIFERTNEISSQKQIIEEKNLRLESAYAEITEQKEVLFGRNEEIRVINSNLKIANDTLAQKNRSFTDSVRYAKRIQLALLPDNEILTQSFLETFTIFLPKAIVSGDMFWIEQKNNSIYIAVIDCTGHGVPGALMSIVAFNLLNQAVNEKRINEPAHILHFMNLGINRTLKHVDEESNYLYDGMDISLCRYDMDTKTIEFSGVTQQLILLRNNELITYKSDKYPAGIYVGAPEAEFIQHSIILQTNDIIYLFTDGYHDQFGGTDRRKYLLKSFKDLLLETHSSGLEMQKNKLLHSLKEWQGVNEQVDDILIMGLKIK